MNKEKEKLSVEERLAAGLPVVYRIEELPQKALDALKKAKMHSRHNHLNKLLDD